MTWRDRLFSPYFLVLLIALAVAGIVYAQLEGGDRGVAPIDSSGSYEVGGINVDVAGKTADEARIGGWREAQRKGWKMLWGRVNAQPTAQAPSLPDSTLDSIVAGIVIEQEEVSATRYIARLGVLFDRGRAGQLLGVHGQIARSAPMLTVPVVYAASTPVTFELRNAWQEAWARFRTGSSAIDYVRVSGVGADPLLLNVAQAGRPGRGWWRILLDQYGAADVVVPEVSLRWVFPGGPVIGTFVARHGPDYQILDTFTLRADSSDALPRMLDAGVRRIDDAYTRALQDGRLTPDPSLAAAESSTDDLADIGNESMAEEIGVTPTTASYAVQVETPDAAALTAAEAGLRGVPGISPVAMTSVALGGVSVFRVGFAGGVEALRLALAARGWRVEANGEVLHISRAPAAPPPTPAAPRPEPPAGGKGAQ